MSVKVAKANYRTIPSLLAERKPFKANTMSAKIEGNEYVIYSYSTPIAWVDLDSGDKTFNETRYSVTTSRQQNLCKAYL